MLALERQQLILQELRERGSARVIELSDAVGVSEMTIRRDLDALADAGHVDRVHGGAALRHQAGSHEPGFDTKQHLQPTEKAAIARTAAELVRPGWTIGLTAGTTNHRLAHELVATDNTFTVVTNSPSIAHVLYTAPQITTVLIGGTRTPSDALVGPLATAALATIHLDLVFLGVHGMAPTIGFTTPNLSESETNRAFVAQTSQLVVVADHTKWEVRAMAAIAPLSAADVVVSDLALPPAAQETIREAGATLLIAKGASPN